MRTFIVALLGVAACSAFVVQSEKNVIEALKAHTISAEAEKLTGEALTTYLNMNQKFFKAHTPSADEKQQMQKKIMEAKYIKAPEQEELRVPEIEGIELAAIPESFDSRQQWPACASTIGHIRDQSDCGSCWSFGAAEAISDRTCIKSNGKVALLLSADDILSCCGFTCGSGCNGGYPIRAWKWWVSHGVCTGADYGDTNSCKPYPLAPCGSGTGTDCPTDGYSTPTCVASCIPQYTSPSYTNDKHFGSTAYAVSKSVAAIQKEIMTNGPVEAAYTVYEDFYQYTGGVYVHTAGAEVGGHAVKMIGWGVDNGTPYWLIANSWGADWGESGFFRIIRGVDNCGIEDGIVGGISK